MAFCTSLESQTVMSLSAYATSAFSKHSLISTVLVVQNVVNGEYIFPLGLFLFSADPRSCYQASYG